jgi:TIR domain-containing protein
MFEDRPECGSRVFGEAMAYIPGVKNDLFISYAHVDNEPDSHNTRWVSEFVRGFAVEVRQRLGGPKDFVLFFDESDLHAHHQLQILLDNARKSAVFVAVLSPSYVSHDWTMKELKEFAAIVDDTRRIVVIEKLPLEVYETYPAEIAQHKRTQFWRRNEPESHTPSTLTAGTSDKYRQTLETLGYQVQQLLREIRRNAEAAERQEREAREQDELNRSLAQTPRRQSEKTVPSAHSIEDPADAPSPSQRTPSQPPGAGLQPDKIDGSIHNSLGHDKPETKSLPRASPPESALMFELLWPENKKNARSRIFAALSTVAIISIALSWTFRAALTPPTTAFLLIATLVVGSLAFHLVVAALGMRLGAMSTIVIIVAMLTAISGQAGARDVGPLAGLFAGMMLAAFVIGICTERKRAEGYSRLLVVTFAAGVVAVTGFMVGVAAADGTKDFSTLIPAFFGIVIGYSIVAAGLTDTVRRLLRHRLSIKQTP